MSYNTYHWITRCCIDNNAFRVLLGLPHFCSASGMFAEARVDCLYTIMRHARDALVRRVRSSLNSILATIAIESLLCNLTRDCWDCKEIQLNLNSEKMYHQMLEELCKRYGKKYTKELKHRLYGGTDLDICRAVIRELQLKLSPEELMKQLEILSESALPKAPLQKGVQRLLHHLHDNNIPIALATNSTNHAVRLHIKAKPKLFKLFHHMVTCQDPEVDRGKPHPDIYLIAASRFPDSPKPAQCLVFEDSAVGVEAAFAAGMQVVMIPPRNAASGFTIIAPKATQIISSLYDFRPEHFGLPPFTDNPELFKRKPVYYNKPKFYIA